MRAVVSHRLRALSLWNQSNSTQMWKVKSGQMPRLTIISRLLMPSSQGTRLMHQLQGPWPCKGLSWADRSVRACLRVTTTWSKLGRSNQKHSRVWPLRRSLVYKTVVSHRVWHQWRARHSSCRLWSQELCGITMHGPNLDKIWSHRSISIRNTLRSKGSRLRC